MFGARALFAGAEGSGIFRVSLFSFSARTCQFMSADVCSTDSGGMPN